jgi:hypothetical protein
LIEKYSARELFDAARRYYRSRQWSQRRSGGTKTTAAAGPEKAAAIREKGTLFSAAMGISNRLSKLPSDETAIKESNDKAKRTSTLVQKTERTAKEREIAQLGSEPRIADSWPQPHRSNGSE